MPLLSFLSNLGMGGGGVEVAVTPPQRGGGTSRRIGKLPQYYSRSVAGFNQIQLPQDEEENEVAIEVLDCAAALLARIEKDRQFASMLAQVERLQRLVGAHIESRRIYDVVEAVKARIQAKKDGQMAKARIEEEEFGELMEIL